MQSSLIALRGGELAARSSRREHSSQRKRRAATATQRSATRAGGSGRTQTSIINHQRSAGMASKRAISQRTARDALTSLRTKLRLPPKQPNSSISMTTGQEAWAELVRGLGRL